MTIGAVLTEPTTAAAAPTEPPAPSVAPTEPAASAALDAVAGAHGEPDRLDARGAPLPATVRLARHWTLLRLGPSVRLVGLDPATALLVEDLSPPLARLVDALDDTAAPAALVAAAARDGADRGQAVSLLRRLADAGAIVDAADDVRRRRRATSVAHVVGDGPLAIGVATGLALAGVGAVHVEASGIVVAEDVGTGYTDADRGRPRGPAAAAAVRRVAPAARTGPLPQRSAPDVTVLADALVPDPSRVAALTAAATAHLPVRLRDGAGLVGPLVLPGRSPCLHCLDLHRLDRDPAWPHVATLLAGRRGRAEPACVAATAALGAAQALAVIDALAATPPPALAATLVVDAHTASVQRREWTGHPRCPCRERSVTDTPCASSPDRETIRS